MDASQDRGNTGGRHFKHFKRVHTSTDQATFGITGPPSRTETAPFPLTITREWAITMSVSTPSVNSLITHAEGMVWKAKCEAMELENARLKREVELANERGDEMKERVEELKEAVQELKEDKVELRERNKELKEEVKRGEEREKGLAARLEGAEGRVAGLVEHAEQQRHEMEENREALVEMRDLARVKKREKEWAQRHVVDLESRLEQEREDKERERAEKEELQRVTVDLRGHIEQDQEGKERERKEKEYLQRVIVELRDQLEREKEKNQVVHPNRQPKKENGVVVADINQQLPTNAEVIDVDAILEETPTSSNPSGDAAMDIDASNSPIDAVSMTPAKQLRKRKQSFKGEPTPPSSSKKLRTSLDATPSESTAVPRCIPPLPRRENVPPRSRSRVVPPLPSTSTSSAHREHESREKSSTLHGTNPATIVSPILAPMSPGPAQLDLSPPDDSLQTPTPSPSALGVTPPPDPTPIAAPPPAIGSQSTASPSPARSSPLSEPPESDSESKPKLDEDDSDDEKEDEDGARPNIKIKEDLALQLPASVVEAYLQDAPHFHIPAPGPSKLHVKRAKMRLVYGGSDQQMVQIIKAGANPAKQGGWGDEKNQGKGKARLKAKGGNGKRRCVYPMPDMNPAMPMLPGESGLLFASRKEFYEEVEGTEEESGGEDDEVRGSEDEDEVPEGDVKEKRRVKKEPEAGKKMRKRVWSVFRRHPQDAEWLYLGEYENTLVGKMTKEQFCWQRDTVQNHWAKLVLKKKKSDVYAAMRARIALRKAGVLPVDDKEGEEALLLKGMGDVKRGKGRPVTEGDVLEAFKNGDEGISILRMRCVGYDRAFIEDIERQHPTVEVVRKKQDTTKSKAAPKAKGKGKRKRSDSFSSDYDPPEAPEASTSRNTAPTAGPTSVSTRTTRSTRARNVQAISSAPAPTSRTHDSSRTGRQEGASGGQAVPPVGLDPEAWIPFAPIQIVNSVNGAGPLFATEQSTGAVLSQHSRGTLLGPTEGPAGLKARTRTPSLPPIQALCATGIRSGGVYLEGEDEDDTRSLSFYASEEE
ncbi:hypothetical protein DFP72DRAFT_923167 [Ephemerocybe angulata]|uniref:DUF6697 domain-containing protein n=1 Tax=Ephemerocybe angulata TaxID=980116 RepID=A0A8H6HH74_9AGAR|nr:hypothetical protein DFP72DRAFT_923167 [Tulosesus angulatus]